MSPFTKSVLWSGLFLLVLVGCDTSTDSDGPPPSALIVEDIDASGDHYAFLDLESGETFPATDSNSTKWDLAFKSTTILMNGGDSGPGRTTGTIVVGAFDDITEVPPGVEFREDAAPDSLVIPTGSDEGWYHYSGPPAHLITPIPGRTILARTNEGNYAKIRVLSYYRGNPDEPGTTDARFYTIEYVVTSGGSTSFE